MGASDIQVIMAASALLYGENDNWREMKKAKTMEKLCAIETDRYPDVNKKTASSRGGEAVIRLRRR